MGMWMPWLVHVSILSFHVTQEHCVVCPEICMTILFISDDPRAAFHPRFLVSNSVQFESSHFPGKFLLMENGTVMAGTPNNGNENFQVEYRPHSIDIFRQGDCFMAFSYNGQPSTSACSITNADITTYFTLG